MLAKLKPYIPFLLLTLAVLSLFWPALFHPFYILYPTFSPLSDSMVIHWPKAYLIAQTWRAGEGLPHWTPLILGGMPLAANQLAMLSYPLAWLFLILPLEPTFNFLFIFHLLLGGFGMYFLLRKGHGLSQAAALLGSLTFALNGKWLAHAAGGHVSMVGAVGWMPWTLFGLMMMLYGGKGAEEQRSRGAGVQGCRGAAGVEALAGERQQMSNLPIFQPSKLPTSLSPYIPTLTWAVLVAITLAMQMVTHTLPVIYSVYLIGAIVGWRFLYLGVDAPDGHFPAEASTPRVEKYRAKIWPLALQAEIKRLWLPLLLIPVLAGLLSAGQLLPLLELVPFSNRSLSLAQAAEFSVSPAQLLIGLLLPSAQGGHEYVIYLGLVPLLLMPFGLSRRNRWSWFYAGLFLLVGLFALGPATPIHRLFYQYAPGFGWVRTPARIFFVGAIATAVLAGFGLDRLNTRQWPDKGRQWLTRLAAALGLLALMLGLGLAFGFGQMSRAPFALALLIPLGLLLIVLRGRQVIPARRASFLLGLLLYLDLASFDLSMIRFVSSEEALAPGRPVAVYLGGKSPLFRVYSPSYSLPMQTAAVYNLFLADGVEPVHLAVYDQYMARAGGYGDASFSVTIPPFGDKPLESALQDAKPNLNLLGLLNVKYIVSAFPIDQPGLRFEMGIEGTYIYDNRAVLPRARVVHQTLPAEPDWLAQLERLPNLADLVLIEDGPHLSEGTRAASAARVSHYTPDSIQVETEISEPGWLVLNEIWYPGWQATVNGQPQPVEKVNGMFRGLYLGQPGRYQVVMEYRPASVVWGNWLAGVTAGLIILIGLIWSWSLKILISK